MILKDEVCRQLAMCVRGEIALRDLSIWLAEHEDEDIAPAALDLVRVTQLIVGEYTGGHIDRARLMVRLAELLDQQRCSEA